MSQGPHPSWHRCRFSGGTREQCHQALRLRGQEGRGWREEMEGSGAPCDLWSVSQPLGKLSHGGSLAGKSLEST